MSYLSLLENGSRRWPCSPQWPQCTVMGVRGRALTRQSAHLPVQALARGQAVRAEVASVKSAVSAAQGQLAAGGGFQGTVVTGTSCLPGPTADLLQIAY